VYEVIYGESSISEGGTEIVSWLGVNVRNFVQHRDEDNVRGRKIIKGERWSVCHVKGVSELLSAVFEQRTLEIKPCRVLQFHIFPCHYPSIPIQPDHLLLLHSCPKHEDGLGFIPSSYYHKTHQVKLLAISYKPS
jgi:hypothetical protein